MESIIELLQKPWPWYIAGPAIGLIVPLLLLIGNKQFGISSSYRHICAAVVPSKKVEFFQYDWKKQSWNLLFAAGVVIGGFLGMYVFKNPEPMALNESTKGALTVFGIHSFDGYIPSDLFSFENLLSLQGMILMIGGGFLVGFGTRYAGGCTSGHAIMGIANLQWTSVVASACFMIGGFITTHLILPFIFGL